MIITYFALKSSSLVDTRKTCHDKYIDVLLAAAYVHVTVKPQIFLLPFNTNRYYLTLRRSHVAMFINKLWRVKGPNKCMASGAFCLGCYCLSLASL